MNIRKEVRAAEERIKSYSDNKEMQIRICSMAQSIARSELTDDHYIMVLAIVKNRIIRSIA